MLQPNTLEGEPSQADRSTAPPAHFWGAQPGPHLPRWEDDLEQGPGPPQTQRFHL